MIGTKIFFGDKKKDRSKKAVLKISTEEEIRTHDPRIHNPML